MKFIIFIALLQLSFISLAAEQSALTGEFRLDLPKRFSSAQVLFVLTEMSVEHSKRDIAYQTEILKHGQSISISLKFNSAAINSKRKYKLVIFVRDLMEEQKVISKASFPVLTFDAPKKIYIAIKIPDKPIESYLGAPLKTGH